MMPLKHTFDYPSVQSQFTTLLSSKSANWSGISVTRIQTSAGYNVSPLDRHMVGLHLGSPVAILHWRDHARHLHHFRPGDIIFTPAGDPVEYAHSESVDAMYISVEPHQVSEIAMREEIAAPDLSFRDNFGTPDPTIYRIGQAFLQELQSPGLGGKLYVEALTIQFIIHLLRHYAEGKPKPDNSQMLIARLKPAVEYIHDHLTENVSLNAIAATVYLTPYHFSRLFKQVYGVSPYQYLIQQRVNVARQLLQNPRLTVSDVALMVGFADHSHLTRHYKRLTGTTPRA